MALPLESGEWGLSILGPLSEATTRSARGLSSILHFAKLTHSGGTRIVSVLRKCSPLHSCIPTHAWHLVSTEYETPKDGPKGREAEYVVR